MALARTLHVLPASVEPPPFALPALHFLAAAVWLLCGAVLFVVLAPALGAGRIFEPAVFALVHALMLGTVMSAIFGTLLQFVPSGLGVPLRSVPLGYWGFWLQQAGVLLLVTGFLVWHGALQGFGWLCILAAVGAVSRNVLRARRHSTSGRMVGLYISAAHSALGIGMLVALSRLGETLGWWQVDRLHLLAAHGMLGAVGFGTMSVIGVSSRMLPTFLMGPGDDTRWLQRYLVGTCIGLLLVASGAAFGLRTVMRAGAILTMLSNVVAVHMGARWFARKQRTLDAALHNVRMAFMLLAASVIPAMWLLSGHAYDMRGWVVLFLFTVPGWLVLMVVSVSTKILPHLSYMRLATRFPGFAAAGSPNALLRSDWLRASGLLMTSGVVMAAVGVTLTPAVVRAGAVLWSAGILLTLGAYALMFSRGRVTPTRAPMVAKP